MDHLQYNAGQLLRLLGARVLRERSKTPPYNFSTPIQVQVHLDFVASRRSKQISRATFHHAERR